MTTTKRDGDNAMQEAVEELLTDPDSPDKGNTNPPQTIDAEPEDEASGDR
ncbi:MULTISPECIES: hypothetical protein [Sphingomonas]|nr:MULTISPECIES: hypothetical protein [Sphingomonas]MBY0301371.1 hypothetical protein [Sphingomonas ginsenosidimutans]